MSHQSSLGLSVDRFFAPLVACQFKSGLDNAQSSRASMPRKAWISRILGSDFCKLIRALSATFQGQRHGCSRPAP